MKTITALLFALLLAPLSGQADEQSPEAMVRQVTDDVLAAIKSDKALQAGDKQKALALAEQKVLPHVDFNEMTRLAAGRAWTSAVPEQRERMVSAFRAMLVRTYANAIDVYRGQTMKVDAAKVPADATEATVRNRYMSPGRQPTPVDYAMRKTPEGWKIYDIVVDGVSIVLTYRSQFNEAAQNGGVEGLIKQLQDKTQAQPAVKPG
jgi:phospholipid transport system substrate-binding protein